MAHSFVRELNEIEKAAQAKAPAAAAASTPKLASPSTPASASALDKVAAQHALKLCEANGYDVKEASERLSAVLILGAKESEKVAQAGDPQTAFHVRALELLEQAQYPVDWSQVFDK